MVYNNFVGIWKEINKLGTIQGSVSEIGLIPALHKYAIGPIITVRPVTRVNAKN